MCHPQGRNAVEDSRRSLRELTHGVPQESPKRGSKQKRRKEEVRKASVIVVFDSNARGFLQLLRHIKMRQLGGTSTL